MATMATMDAPARPRSGSSSRIMPLIRDSRQNRFSRDDAALLANTLRSLETLLNSMPLEEHHQINFNQFSASHERHVAEDIPRLCRLVLTQRIRRAMGVPAAYGQAYRAALARRPFVNKIRIDDWHTGRECTCSEALQALPAIDQLLGTRLVARYHELETQVEPFPFFRLPAELRLHVYDHVLPRGTHFSLEGQPALYKAPSRTVGLLRLSKDMHAEATKYLYEKHTLFMLFRGGQREEGYV
ncbi:hypothetical protein EJ04DRAFT_29157 [Polyplosphaeria fusca]|uniref:Uncharacterized protein n=1 Tax=Polyplosphaeria fusca TaxID=682080 RepID=A0A9P4UZA0_9PLEO|nr:hypothetical protein EJ04DRAFT_29157 [Polyplosphaeria fusca]